MDNPIAHAEMLVKNALDDLKVTGALQPLNQMDIAALLNLAVETHSIFNAMDEDVFKSMMDVKKLWDSVGGDDDDIDMPAPGPATCRRSL